MNDGTPLKVQLKRRETWAYIAGIFIGVFSVVSTVVLEAVGVQDVASVQAEFVALAVGLVTAFLGTGATAQIKRGQQRGEEAARAVQQAASPYLNLDTRTPISREPAVDRPLPPPISGAGGQVLRADGTMQPAPVVQPPPSPVVNPSSPVTLIQHPGTDPMADATHVLPNAPTDDDRIGQ